MKFTINEKKVQVSGDVRAYAEKKISKLDRFFRDESEATVMFTSERGRYIAEVTLNNNGMFYRVSETTSDIYASIDSAVAAIERQIRKHKTRLAKRLRDGVFEKGAEVPAVSETEETEEPEFKIVRTKAFSMKPMTPEEAILQMNLLDHTFFAFKNQSIENAFSVVYKRKDGGYGLINEE